VPPAKSSPASIACSHSDRQPLPLACDRCRAHAFCARAALDVAIKPPMRHRPHGTAPKSPSATVYVCMLLYHQHKDPPLACRASLCFSARTTPYRCHRNYIGSNHARTDDGQWEVKDERRIEQLRRPCGHIQPPFDRQVDSQFSHSPPHHTSALQSPFTHTFTQPIDLSKWLLSPPTAQPRPSSRTARLWLLPGLRSLLRS